MTLVTLDERNNFLNLIFKCRSLAPTHSHPEAQAKAEYNDLQVF